MCQVHIKRNGDLTHVIATFVAPETIIGKDRYKTVRSSCFMDRSRTYMEEYVRALREYADTIEKVMNEDKPMPPYGWHERQV